MKFITSIILLSLLMATYLPISADEPPTPTPMPRVYSQEGINEIMAVITEQYGIAFAFPEEWIATTANEVQWFTDDLHGILNSLNTAAHYLYIYGEAPKDVTPSEFFRQIYDPAKIQLDRAMQITGGFTGNTLPMYEDGEVAYYLVQLHPAAMAGGFVLIHELGHVLDGLLEDQAQRDFRAELGGEMTPEAWIPGADYIGNEALFPRAVGGANEDFADTFANLLLGRLSAEIAPNRYEFMLEFLPVWLANLENLPLPN